MCKIKSVDLEVFFIKKIFWLIYHLRIMVVSVVGSYIQHGEKKAFGGVGWARRRKLLDGCYG